MVLSEAYRTKSPVNPHKYVLNKREGKPEDRGGKPGDRGGKPGDRPDKTRQDKKYKKMKKPKVQTTRRLKKTQKYETRRQEEAEGPTRPEPRGKHQRSGQRWTK